MDALKARAKMAGLDVDELANKILSNALSLSLEGTTLEDEITFTNMEQMQGLKGKTFTEEGARAYAAAARYEFQKYSSLKGVDWMIALEELSNIAKKYDYDFQFISQILMGKHVLSSAEMALAINDSGKCPMQTTLQEWTGDPLHSLARVCVEAISVC